MLYLKEIIPIKESNVSCVPDFLASIDLNLNIFYDEKRFGVLNGNVEHLRVNTEDNKRLLNFDLDKYHGFLVRIESPNLIVKRNTGSHMVFEKVDVGIPCFGLKGVKPDPRFKNDNIYDIVIDPILHVYDDAVVFDTGLKSSGSDEVISPCEGLYFVFSTSGSLAKISFFPKDLNCLRRLEI